MTTLHKPVFLNTLLTFCIVFGAAAPLLAKESHHESTNKAVDLDKPTRWLKNGNERFLTGKLRKDGQSQHDIEKLSSGQKPHTIVLSCSDSRVPPEIVFDQKLGELFVVRTAGESLDANAIGSIEYAVEHLGAQNLLVMGHTSCGAVKAALQTIGGKDAGSPSLNKLVADLHPRLTKFKDKTPSHNVEMETWANAKGVAKDLLERSEILSHAVKEGKLKISTSVYYLENGKVKFE